MHEKSKRCIPPDHVLFDRVLERISELTGSEPSSAIDLACGNSELVHLSASHSIDTIVLDFSQKVLDNTECSVTNMPNHNGKVKFEKQDLNRYSDSGEPNKADVIFMKLAFALIQDKEGFLAYVKNSLATRGVFVLMNPVIIPGYKYTEFDKNISVPIAKVETVLKQTFSYVEEFNCSYSADTIVDMTYLAIDD